MYHDVQWQLEGYDYDAETPEVRHRYVVAVRPLWYVNGVERWLRAECSRRSRAVVISADGERRAMCLAARRESKFGGV